MGPEIRSLAVAAALAASLLIPLLIPIEAAAAGPVGSGSDLGVLVEIDHQLELSFDRGHATLRGEWTVQNVGPEIDDAILVLVEPGPAVATGLRLRDAAGPRPRWRDARLLEREAAWDAYFGTEAGSRPGVAALLQREEYGEDLELLVGPLAPASRQTVEYTLTIPARWDGGRWQLELGNLGDRDHPVPVPVTLVPARAGDRLFVDGRAVVDGHVSRPINAITVELEPRDPVAIELGLASVDTGDDRSAVRVRTAVASLSELPRDARVVVILDLSRSRSDEELEAQRAAALAYLEHLRPPALGAEVAVLGFDRVVHPISDGLAPASVAIERLEQATLTRQNGSEIGLALAEAESLLRTSNHRGPRRILLLSDFWTASRITAAQLERAAVRSGAVVHLAGVGPGVAWLERDDTHPWSSLAAATGGVYWDAGVDAADPAATHAVLEEWVRPLRIDGVDLRLDGRPLIDVATDGCPACELATLAEGEGFEALLLADGAVGRLSLDGLRWSEPIHLEARSSAAEDRRFAALALASPLGERLDRDERTRLAKLGGAVSSQTSLFVATPGSRVEREWVFGGSSTCMCDREIRGASVSHGRRVERWIDPFDPEAWLALTAPGRWRACGGGELGAELSVETTWDELVDIELRTEAGDAVQTCMIESIWALELPAWFTRESAGRYAITLAARHGATAVTSTW